MRLIGTVNSGNQVAIRAAPSSCSLESQLHFVLFCFLLCRLVSFLCWEPQHRFFWSSSCPSVSMVRSVMSLLQLYTDLQKDFISLTLDHKSTFVAMGWGILDWYPWQKHTVGVGEEQQSLGGAVVQESRQMRE